jgi:phosphatidylserine/phosphatidylglycerophosphate/cardiolipin synthase-like enzyme
MIRSLFSRATGFSSASQNGAIDTTFLRDVSNGGDKGQPGMIAKQIADFVGGARSSIHISIYDFRLSQELGSQLIDKLIGQANAGLEVRIAYDHTKPNTKGAPPENAADAFSFLGGDPAPKGTHQRMLATFRGTKVQTKPILTIPDGVADTPVGTEPIEGSHLMHNKYIVRDVNTAQAGVLTGSTNFTDDAWTHQENNIIVVNSPALAAYYETDFQELWASGNIASTGVNDSGNVMVGTSDVAVAFAPGEGPSIDAHLASLVSAARKRIKVCSMVLSSQKILGALSDAISTAQIDMSQFGGIYDATQMSNVLRMWQKSGNPAIQTFQAVAKHLVFKRSKPYSPTGLHDFMHNKILVCDDTVATGSFNLSSNATHNAENSLVVQEQAVADSYSDYIDTLVKEYGK